MSTVLDFAIIGAGTSGCFVASQLAERGYDVCIIEKSRGVGGRCSRRKFADGSVDLGAPAFRSDRLIYYPKQAHLWRQRLNHWLNEHWVTRWTYSVAQFDSPQQISMDQQLCGIPNMNRLHRQLTESVPILTRSRVVALKHEEGVWLLKGDDQSVIARAHKVIVTVPAQQSLALFDWPKSWLEVIEPVATRTRAQWVAVLHFERPQLHLSDVYRGDHPVLIEAVRDSSKPLRRHQGEYWVLQSTLEWADQRRDTAPDQASTQLKQAFLQCVGSSLDPAVVSCHRWLLAHHGDRIADQDHLWCPQLNLGLCGDWFLGGGIAGALMSGQQLIDALLPSPNISTVISPVMKGEKV